MTVSTLAQIVFVLDRSGSMEPLRRVAVEDFTTLFDAVAGTMDRVGARQVAFPEEWRPAKYVSKWIRHQTETYGLDFLFLGVLASWLEQAKEMGILAANAAAFVPTEQGLEMAMCEASERVGRARGGVRS